MTGGWKAWKTKLRFPTLPTTLGNRGDFHIPTAPATSLPPKTVQNQTKRKEPYRS